MSEPIEEFDNTHALTEGWGIFECYGSGNGPWQLAKDDEQDAFGNDEDAWAHVKAKAAAGSAYHQSALEFLKENNPIEYAAIMEGREAAIAAQKAYFKESNEDEV